MHGGMKVFINVSGQLFRLVRAGTHLDIAKRGAVVVINLAVRGVGKNSLGAILRRQDEDYHIGCNPSVHVFLRHFSDVAALAGTGLRVQITISAIVLARFVLTFRITPPVGDPVGGAPGRALGRTFFLTRAAASPTHRVLDTEAFVELARPIRGTVVAASRSPAPLAFASREGLYDGVRRGMGAQQGDGDARL